MARGASDGGGDDDFDPFVRALSNLDSSEFAPEPAAPRPVKKKKKSVFTKVSHALFGSRKKKQLLKPPEPATVCFEYSDDDLSGELRSEEEIKTESIDAFSNTTARRSDHTQSVRPESPPRLPPDTPPTGRHAVHYSARPDSPSRVRLAAVPEDFTDLRSEAAALLGSAWNPSEPGDVSEAADRVTSSLMEPPVITISQPPQVKLVKPKKAGWFGGGNKNSPSPTVDAAATTLSKSDLKKRLKRIEYLREAKDALDEVELFGMDSMALPMRTFEMAEAEERRKVTALLRETREGFEVFLNEFCKAIYARHGRHCIWRQLLKKSVLRPKPEDAHQLDIDQIVAEVRAQELALQNNSVPVFLELAKGRTTISSVDWSILCAEDASMITKIAAAKACCLQVVRKYFSDESDTVTLFTATPEFELDDSWLNDRGLDANQLQTYNKAKDSMNLVERIEMLTEDVARGATERCSKNLTLLRQDLERIESMATNLIDRYYADFVESIELPGAARRRPQPVSSPLTSHEGRGGVSGGEKIDVIEIVTKAMAAARKRQFGAGLAVTFTETEGVVSFQRWLNDALYWQSVDLKLAHNLQRTRVQLSEMVTEKKRILLEGLAEKLTLLWASEAQQVQEAGLNDLTDHLDTALTTGGSFAVCIEDERQCMALEDTLGWMNLGWTQQFRDSKAKSSALKLPLKTAADVAHLRDLFTEFACTLDRDASLIEDLEVQVAIDAAQKEVFATEARLKTLKNKQNTKDSSLSKTLTQLQKKKDELLAQIAAEEERGDALDGVKHENEKLVMEVAELKETLALLKQSVKEKKAENISNAKNIRLAAEVESLQKEIEKQSIKAASLEVDGNQAKSKKQSFTHWFGGIVAKGSPGPVKPPPPGGPNPLPRPSSMEIIANPSPRRVAKRNSVEYSVSPLNFSGIVNSTVCEKTPTTMTERMMKPLSPIHSVPATDEEGRTSHSKLSESPQPPSDAPSTPSLIPVPAPTPILPVQAPMPLPPAQAPTTVLPVQAPAPTAVLPTPAPTPVPPLQPPAAVFPVHAPLPPVPKASFPSSHGMSTVFSVGSDDIQSRADLTGGEATIRKKKKNAFGAFFGKVVRVGVSPIRKSIRRRNSQPEGVEITSDTECLKDGKTLSKLTRKERARCQSVSYAKSTAILDMLNPMPTKPKSLLAMKEESLSGTGATGPGGTSLNESGEIAETESMSLLPLSELHSEINTPAQHRQNSPPPPFGELEKLVPAASGPTPETLHTLKHSDSNVGSGHLSFNFSYSPRVSSPERRAMEFEKTTNNRFSSLSFSQPPDLAFPQETVSDVGAASASTSNMSDPRAVVRSHLSDPIEQDKVSSDERPTRRKGSERRQVEQPQLPAQTDIPRVSLTPSSPTQRQMSDTTFMMVRPGIVGAVSDDEASSVSKSVTGGSDIGVKKKKSLWKKLMIRSKLSSSSKQATAVELPP